MAFSELELARVHRTMTAYIARRRPRPEIREELDIGYSLEGQSVIIHEDRRLYDGSRILEPVAKATWVKTQKTWKVSPTALCLTKSAACAGVKVR